MISCVIDANIFVAEFKRDEPNSKEAREFLRFMREEGLSLAAPVTLLAEVAGAIARGAGKPLMGERAVSHLLARQELRLMDVDAGLATVAAAIAARQRLRGYDAIYLALADRLSAPLVSLDLEVMRRAPSTITVAPPSPLLASWQSRA
jgi:predicted nucleic acid-binding protein